MVFSGPPAGAFLDSSPRECFGASVGKNASGFGVLRDSVAPCDVFVATRGWLKPRGGSATTRRAWLSDRSRLLTAPAGSLKVPADFFTVRAGSLTVRRDLLTLPADFFPAPACVSTLRAGFLTMGLLPARSWSSASSAALFGSWGG